MSLYDFGFTPFFARELAGSDLEPARITATCGELQRAVTDEGERAVSVSGRLRHQAASPADLPAVGDWVGLNGSRIERVLPRRTKLSRKVAGKRTSEQVVAANVDQVVIVMGLDGDFSERRLERYLTTVWESGALPAILLNKIDLAPDFEAVKREITLSSPGVPVVVASCVDRTGLDEVRGLLQSGETGVLVGSSGVGKSTLINRLLGEDRQRTHQVSPRDDRGQHTTTSRELFVLPGGALLIDNPGIRELQLWASEESVEQSFDDIARLAMECRYRDCAHETEPGCEVTRAIVDGRLSPERLGSFRSLEREVRYIERQQDDLARRAEKQRWRAIHRQMRKPGTHRRT